ncbi:MAG TPA: thermonuclease family protein [Caulobacteraceae bacterium]|jgi:endonuclease YncB( thermonuclease family)|nr:thermonuclease family protein [Caulobacteraceae bacterium]
MLAMLAAVALAAAQLPVLYPAQVLSVIDGDTVKVTVADWPAPFAIIDVRVDGIDAPEHVRPPAKSACEVRLGLAAQAFARSILKPGDRVVLRWRPGTHDQYFRLLAGVSMPDGSDYAAHMIAAHMARPYTAADLHKAAWCAGGRPIPITPAPPPAR